MTDTGIPEAVKQLISERIDTIPEIEMVLLLRLERAQSWSTGEAGARLHVNASVAAHILGVLTQRGFLAREHGQFHYAPESPELEAKVTQLAESYSRQLIAVTNLVHAKPTPG